MQQLVAMRLVVLVVLAIAGPAVADPVGEPERPRFTIRCDYDGWTCTDNFPAISRDHLTIASVVIRGDALVVELVSVATSRVLRRETAFVAEPGFPTAVRVARLHRELRDFRAMALVSEEVGRTIYKRGTVTLQIDDCASACRARYRVTRRRR